MSFLRQVRAVIWSFIGVRRGADAARDLEGAKPLTIILVGIVVAALIVLGIVTLVHFIVSTRPATLRQGASTTLPQAGAPAAAKHRGPVMVADTMEERLRPCTGCHGNSTEPTRDGFSPRLAGKPAGYLQNQLVGFRDGLRTYGPMVYLVQYMSDDYLREIAQYFSALDLPYPPPESIVLSAEMHARVEQLIEHGDAARGVPACVECHGATLAGANPAIPGLLGLPRHYIAAQFGAWRNGRLRSIAPDCMAEVARRLAPDDVPALAAWLGSQPVPAGVHAEPGNRRPLPLECGSVNAALR